MSIGQLWIVLTGVFAVFLTQCAPRLQRFACLFGMAGQPAWIYAALQSRQLGVLIVSALYTLAWGKGIWTHWLWLPWVKYRQRGMRQGGRYS